MRVSQQKSNYRISKIIKYALFAAIVFFLVRWAFDYIKKHSGSLEDQEYFCDAEGVSGNKFITNGVEFLGGGTQSSQDAYTGKYSSKCYATQIYSMTLALPSANELDTIKVSCAIKCVNAGARVVVSSGANELFKFASVKADRKGWQIVDYEVVLPMGFKPGDTKVYAYYTDGGGHIFVDDMKVSVKVFDESAPIQKYDGSQLRIKLSNDNFEKIKAKRKEALEQGLLFSSKEDLVDGDVRIGDKSYAAKLRLKGDLLDHLRGDQWSFRVQLKKGDEWNGMKNFSIHNSKARSHISEWVMHRLFKDEGIMTPAYDFIGVELNEKPLGVYAYEQHFDNQLLKYNDRLIGPILKHNDDAYWENVQKYLDPFPWIDASYIELFNKENGKDENFKLLFDQGQSMLNDFLHERKTPKEVFNMDKLTTYYALLDLSHSLHAQIFTNIRFYLDPQTGLLEPIGFDCFGSEKENVTPGWNAVGEGVNERYANQPKNNLENIYQFHLLKDPEFFELYMEKIYYYTSPDFLKEKQIEYGKEINARELFIKSDKAYADYEFSWEHLFNKAEFTRKKLAPKDNMSLRAFRSPRGKQVIDIMSYHPFPLEILGFVDERGAVDSLAKPLLIESYNEYIPVRTYELQSKDVIKSVLFRALGNPKEFLAPVIKNYLPQRNVDVIRSDINELAKFSFINVNDKVVTISSGSNIVTEAIVIPKGYTLNISPGAELFFKGGSLLSYSPIKAIASEKQKIIFRSDGRSGSGILLSGVDQESLFRYCAFSKLGNYYVKNIRTKGSVNVYNSKVNFENCVFAGSIARQNLSAVFSEVSLVNCNYINSKGDAINGKYSSVDINSVQVNEVGRNGINMTGGSLTGEGIIISKAFTRAIKCDDRVYGNAKDVEIMDSEIGIVLSQNSNLTLANCTLKNVNNGLIVKGKSTKTSTLNISDYKSEEVSNEYKVDNDSLLKLNGVIKK